VTNILRGELTVQQIDVWHGKVVIESSEMSSLERFRMIVQRDRIRAAARRILRKSIQENQIVFFLNKQAAFAGHVSFTEPEGESPLGPIQVTVETTNPEQLIDWMTGQPEEREKE